MCVKKSLFIDTAIKLTKSEVATFSQQRMMGCLEIGNFTSCISSNVEFNYRLNLIIDIKTMLVIRGPVSLYLYISFLYSSLF